MHLRDAVQEVMQDPEVRGRYPQGLTGSEVLIEIRKKHPGGFPLCSPLDVIDELRILYGERR